jgi:hypothetical protein
MKNGREKTYRALYLGAGPWRSTKTVPAIFYDTFNNTVKAIEQITREEDDVFEGEQCYVVSGMRHNHAVRLWISKPRLLILKREEEIDFESPTYIRGKWQIERSLKAMAKKVTPEAIKLMQEKIEDGFAKKTLTNGLVVEIQREIVVDEPVSKEALEPSTAAGPGGK